MNTPATGVDLVLKLVDAEQTHDDDAPDAEFIGDAPDDDAPHAAENDSAAANAPHATDTQSAAASPGRKRRKRGEEVGAAIDYVMRFAMHRDGPTLRKWRGDFYRWTAEHGCYVPITDDQVLASLHREFRINRTQDARKIRDALIAVDDVLIDHAQIGEWIGAPTVDHPVLELAPCRNGLLHLDSRTLYPATPRYFATTSLGVSYERAAPSPTRWLSFLRELWPHKDHAAEIRQAITVGDEETANRLRIEQRNSDESIAALQEWFGYMLAPDTRQQKIMLLVGPKRSGKGTIGRVLRALLGRESVAAPTLASLGTNFGLWPLIGKSAAIIGDARLGGRTDIAQVVERLLSISGEDAQTIDRKHREPWTGYLSTRITIISNELPRFADASDALASRMLILELEHSFYGKEDTGLTDALLAELPGILHWAIDGWDHLHRRGHFVQPAASAALVDDMADLASPVAAWVRERCKRGPKCKVECTVAFRDYQAWATEQGHQHKVTLTTFGRDLKAAAQVVRVQVREGTNRPWVYRGIELRKLGEVDDAG
ncbi:MAG TPA: phage/plasmid primase, P4 family [Kofleriaceae bacterium]